MTTVRKPDAGQLVVYVATNKITGRQYVGITKDLERRWQYHLAWARRRSDPGHLLQADIAKYGSEAFTVEAVACARNWQDLREAERIIIRQIGSHHTRGGYNRTYGGDGGPDRRTGEAAMSAETAAFVGALDDLVTAALRAGVRKSDLRRALAASRQRLLVEP